MTKPWIVQPNGKGPLSELTLEEVGELRLKNACGIKGSKVKIPTLEEIMLLAKGKIMVNLDKTEGETVLEAYKILKKTGTVNHAIFKGNDPVEVMRERYGSIMDSIIYMPKLWYENSSVDSFLEDFERDLNPFVYETLFDNEEANTYKLLPQLEKQGDSFLAIALWDELCAGRTDELALLEGPEVAWGWLIEQGADGIMTDRPAELLEYLRGRRLHE